MQKTEIKIRLQLTYNYPEENKIPCQKIKKLGCTNLQD